MTKDEALRMALEALEGADEIDVDMQAAITAIKEALAQPKQTNTRPYYTIDELNAWADEKEKQAWRNAAIRIGEELSSFGPDGYYDMNAWQWLDWAMENVKKAQPEQEPVAWEQFHEHMAGPFYKAPPQPEKEPVAWGVFEGNLHDMFFTEAEAVEMAQLKGNHAEVKPLYTAPQRKPQYDKTKMNCFVQDLYDKKIQEGKHGQYEAMFHVVHRAIEAAHGIKE